LRKKAKKTELFQYDKSNRRQSYRVKPSQDDPVLINILNREKKATDISAGGLSFKNGGDFKTGDIFSAKIKIPGYPKIISTDIVIVAVCRDNRCHCRFLELDREQSEMIHLYCLSRQKENIDLSKNS